MCSLFYESAQLHPAVQMISYYMGDDVSDADFLFSGRKLVRLKIANDFISMPTVTMATIQVPDKPRGARNGFKVKVKNSKGVKLIDLFRGIAEESSREVCGGGPEIEARRLFGETITRTTLLGDHRYYEGMSGAMRTGLGLSAEVRLGS